MKIFIVCIDFAKVAMNENMGNIRIVEYVLLGGEPCSLNSTENIDGYIKLLHAGIVLTLFAPQSVSFEGRLNI